MICHLDLETWSEVPIRDGTFAYAAGATPIIWAWAIDDGAVQVHDATCGNAAVPPGLLDLLAEADEIVIHNSMFDRTVLRANDIDIPTSKIFDTMVGALSHGLPGGLDKLCEIFKVPTDKAKDKAGKQLIQLFCKPRPANVKLRRATRETHPVEWQRFLDYAALDIEAMRVLHKKLPRWNYEIGNHGHALWCLDQRINDRGYRVDTDLARAAIDTVALAKKAKDNRTHDLTDGDVRSATQRDAMLRHLLAEYGVDLPDMQKSTLERCMADEDLPEPVKELLAARLQVGTTVPSKYGVLLKGVSDDGRLRGTLQFCGAPRTKRWSGRLFQPQNLIRTPGWFTADEQEMAVTFMKAGIADSFYEEPIEIASFCVRGSIIADEDKKLVVSDLEQIEARCLPWLAGEEWELEDFRAYDRGEGYDNYVNNAARILGKHPSLVTKWERQAYGKVVVLASGYGGAAGAFAQFARIYGVELPDEEVFEIIRAWRAAHPALCDWGSGFWTQLDDAARRAIAAPGKIIQAGEHIAFERWRSWLKMHLPSGGFLSYAAPAIRIDPRTKRESVSFYGINNYSRKWECMFTYGGKLSADATQSTAREVLASNLPDIEAAGYDLLALVHDETVTETPDDDNYSVDILSGLLARNRSWNQGLPLAANGFEGFRYRKGE
jgi:DNA polymerase bacteriophage-type